MITPALVQTAITSGFWGALSITVFHFWLHWDDGQPASQAPIGTTPRGTQTIVTYSNATKPDSMPRDGSIEDDTKKDESTETDTTKKSSGVSSGGTAKKEDESDTGSASSSGNNGTTRNGTKPKRPSSNVGLLPGGGKTITQLKAEIAVLTEALTVADDENNQFRAEANTSKELQKKIDKLEEELEQAKSAPTRSSTEVEAENASTLSETQAQLKQVNADLAVQTQELQAAGTKLKSTNDEVSSAQGKVRTENNELERIKGEIVNANTLAETAKLQCKEAEEKSVKVQQDLTTSEEDLKQRRSALNSLDAELEQKRADREKGLNAEIEQEKRNRLTQLQQEIKQEKQRRLTLLQQAMDRDKQSRLSQLSSDVEAKKATDFANVESELATRKQELDTTKKDLVTQTTKHTKTCNDIKDAEKRLNTLQQSVQQDETTKSQLQGEVESVTKALNDIKASRTREQQDLDAVNKDLNQKREAVVSEDEALKVKQRQIQAAEEQFKLLHKQANEALQEKRREIQTAEDDLSTINQNGRQAEERLNWISNQLRLRESQWNAQQQYGNAQSSTDQPIPGTTIPSYGNEDNDDPSEAMAQSPPLNGTTADGFDSQQDPNALKFDFLGQNNAQDDPTQPFDGSEGYGYPANSFNGNGRDTGDEMDGIEGGSGMVVNTDGAPPRNYAPQQGSNPYNLPAAAPPAGQPFNTPGLGRDGVINAANEPTSTAENMIDPMLSEPMLSPQQDRGDAVSGQNATSDGPAAQQTNDSTSAAQGPLGIFEGGTAPAAPQVNPNAASNRQDDDFNVDEGDVQEAVNQANEDDRFLRDRQQHSSQPTGLDASFTAQKRLGVFGSGSATATFSFTSTTGQTHEDEEEEEEDWTAEAQREENFQAMGGRPDDYNDGRGERTQNIGPQSGTATGRSAGGNAKTTGQAKQTARDGPSVQPNEHAAAPESQQSLENIIEGRDTSSIQTPFAASESTTAPTASSVIGVAGRRKLAAPRKSRPPPLPLDVDVRNYLFADKGIALGRLRKHFQIEEGDSRNTAFIAQLRRHGWHETALPKQEAKPSTEKKEGLSAEARAKLDKLLPSDEEIRGHLLFQRATSDDFCAHFEIDKSNTQLYQRFIERLASWNRKPTIKGIPTNDEINKFFKAKDKSEVKMPEVCETFGVPKKDGVLYERLCKQLEDLGHQVPDSVEIESLTGSYDEMDDGEGNHDDHQDGQGPGEGADGAAQGNEGDDMTGDDNQPSSHGASHSGTGNDYTNGDDNNHRPSQKDNDDQGDNDSKRDSNSEDDDADNGQGPPVRQANHEEVSQSNEPLPTDREIEDYFNDRMVGVDSVHELIVTWEEVCERFHVSPFDEQRQKDIRHLIEDGLEWPITNLPFDEEVRDFFADHPELTSMKVGENFGIYKDDDDMRLFKAYCQQLERLNLPTIAADEDDNGDEGRSEDDLSLPDDDESDEDEESSDEGNDEDEEAHSDDERELFGSNSIPKLRRGKNKSEQRKRSESPEAPKIGGMSAAEAYQHVLSPFASSQAERYAFFERRGYSPYATPTPTTPAHRPTPSPIYPQAQGYPPAFTPVAGGPTYRPSVPSQNDLYSQQSSLAYNRWVGSGAAPTYNPSAVSPAVAAARKKAAEDGERMRQKKRKPRDESDD